MAASTIDLTAAAAGWETTACFCARLPPAQFQRTAVPLELGPGAVESIEMGETHEGAFLATGCGRRRPLLMVDPPLGSVRTTAGTVHSLVW